jgi:hypothetical protein
MSLIESVRPGDTVTIVTPHGSQLKGRAVMPSSHGGWVLNGGGRHGTPLLADDSNTIKVSKSRAKKPAGFIR